MRYLLRIKVATSTICHRHLMAVGAGLLGEATTDKFWGIGMNISDPRARDCRNWTGRNMMGQLWMELYHSILSMDR